MLLLHAQRERETLSVGVARRMRTTGSPRIAPCDLCEPLKKHRRRKICSESAKLSAVVARTMRPRVTPGPGQTTATRDQKAKHRPVDVAGSRRETSPAGERKECRSRRPVREGASSQRHQARAPSAPPPTAPDDDTVQPPRRTHILPHILAGVPFEGALII